MELQDIAMLIDAIGIPCQTFHSSLAGLMAIG